MPIYILKGNPRQKDQGPVSKSFFSMISLAIGLQQKLSFVSNGHNGHNNGHKLIELPKLNNNN